MRALVVQVVLDELEARNAHRVEAKVIGAACIAHRERCHAEVFQGRYPLRKDGTMAAFPWK